MAVLYPEEFPPEKRANPKFDGEAFFYDTCGALPPDYRVFYSMSWLGERRGGGEEEGEVDFVVLHQKHGLMFLEVKGGGVKFNRRKGTWSSIDRFDNEHKIPNPIDRVTAGRHAITKYLAKYLKLDVAPAAARAVVFPHTHYNHSILSALNWPRELTLFEDDIDEDKLEASLKRAFKYASGETHTSYPALTASQIQAIERLWAQGDARSVLASYITQDALAIQRLTDQQCEILDSMRSFRRLAVRGGAGTGKTVLALEKATRLAQQGLNTLLTCRTPLLGKHLAKLVEELPEPCPLIRDFRELCIECGLAAKVLRERPANPREKRWTTELPNVLMRALDVAQEPRFDAVVVDEAQDFEEGWWDPLQLTLKEGDEGTLWIFYDDNQRVFPRPPDFPNLPSVDLNVNLRNTREIFSVFRPFYPGDQYRPSGPAGQPVKVTPIRDASALPEVLRSRLHFLISEQKVEYRDIAVLTGLPLSQSFSPHSALVGREKVGTFRLNTEDYPPPPGQVSLQSILSFKGMESSAVIVVELEQCLSDDAVLYIGLSRAKTYLEIIGTERVSEFVQSGKLKLL